MTRYINASSLYDKVEAIYKYATADKRETAKTFLDLICEEPTANVVEVRRGKWKLHDDGSATCLECGCRQLHIWDFDNHQNFCGYCGADMREARNDG